MLSNVRLFLKNGCKKTGIKQYIVDAWKEAFPNEEDRIREKYKKKKQERRYSQEELDKMQEERPEWLKGAVVEAAPVVEPESMSQKYIPESLRNRISSSESYKEYVAFKENAKEYVATSDNVGVNLTALAYNKLAGGSKISRGIEIMRQIVPDFDITELEKESTFLFKETYEAYLSENKKVLELITTGEAFEAFQSLIKINKTKNQQTKFKELFFYYPSLLNNALLAEKSMPQFQFHMKVIEIYCMIDLQGKIVDGADDRVTSSVYEFGIVYSGEHVAEVGHPWQICVVKKLDEVKMII